MLVLYSGITASRTSPFDGRNDMTYKILHQIRSVISKTEKGRYISLKVSE